MLKYHWDISPVSKVPVHSTYVPLALSPAAQQLPKDQIVSNYWFHTKLKMSMCWAKEAARAVLSSGRFGTGYTLIGGTWSLVTLHIKVGLEKGCD